MRLFARALHAITLAAPLLLSAAAPARAYSVLTHEQLIDLTWQQSIVPLLLSRYPGLTPAQLEEARSYAYGGCVIQDIGYYPFGDPFFSDLTHYVRTGDFVVNLFRTAHNPDELAFAVGALSHYIGDTIGHPEATNIAVPVEFPKLRARFGHSVSFAEAKDAHVQTEFAFDIDQIAHRRLAPAHYLRHVGLNVPTGQLASAFYETYGLGEDFSQRRGRRVNVRGYRFAVRSFLPRFAYAVTLLHRKRLPPDSGSPAFLKLQGEIDQIALENHWEMFRKRPGIGTYSLAAFIWVMPRIGPLKLLAVRGPTAATEEEYVTSVNRSVDVLSSTLSRFALAHQTLGNLDLDTGSATRPGSYRLADDTYARLLHNLAADPRQPVPPGLKAEIAHFYADPAAPIATRNDPKRWAEVQADLQTLQTMTVGAQPVAAETE